MRVKLSYTVDAEDVLSEAAKIINLGSDDMQHAIHLFSATQQALRKDEERDVGPDALRALEMIDDFRKALLNVDTRLDEVTSIVEGYLEYQKTLRAEDARPTPLSSEEAKVGQE